MEWTGRVLLLAVALLALAGVVGKFFGPKAEGRYLRALDVGSAGLMWLTVGAMAAVILIAVITSFL
jgi:hypothetical protein